MQDGYSYSLADDFEEDYVLPDTPSNLLDPPMWNVDTTSGQCGTWQKQYTKLHRGEYDLMIGCKCCIT